MKDTGSFSSDTSASRTEADQVRPTSPVPNAISTANILTVERGKEIQTGHLLKLLPVFETVCPNRGRLKNISMLSHRAFEFSNSV